MIFSFEGNEVHLRDYLYILRKRKGLITLFFLFCFAMGIVYTVRENVVFQAVTTILIERDNPNIVDFKEVMSLDASTTDYYQTQYLMLRSDSLIKKLIDKEWLLQDPYFQGMQKGFLRRILNEQTVVPLPVWMQQFIVEPSPESLVVKNMLKIKPVRNSRLVQVYIRHANPERAASIANSLVQLSIERNLEDRFRVANQATQLIADQSQELKEKVNAAERKLQDYKEEHDLVTIPNMRDQDEFIQEAKLELVKIQAEESKLSKRYLPAHPKRIHIRSQVEGLEAKIAEEEAKMLALSGVAIDYAQLEREANSARQIYQALLERLEETTSEAKTQASNVMVIDRAVAPPRPYKPRPVLNMLIAIFLGAFGGVLLAFFMEYFDSTIKVPEDIERGVGLELLGVIPVGGRNRRGPLKGEFFFDARQPSPAAEAFRALRTALLFRLRHIKGCRVLLMTSPNPEEGKTTVTLNLSAAFQHNNLKVLIIDCDLRKPRLHKAFKVNAGQGVKEVLEGEAQHGEVIQKNIGELGFDFMSSGALSDHPTELLGSLAMDQMMQNLREEYDVIIVDSPPFLAVADVVVLSEYVDGIIIATCYQKTDKRHLRDIRRRFSDGASKILGAVINRVGVKEKDHYYHQYYYYGYGDQKKRK